MKLSLFSLLGPATLVIGLCSQASADSVPSAIQARYAAGISATEKSEFEPFAACFAPTFVFVDASGKTLSRKAWLSDVQTNMKETKKATVKLVFNSVETHGGVVDVSFDNTMKFTSKAGVTTIHEIGIDSWKKIGKTWFVFKTVDKTMDVTPPAAPKPKA